MFLLEAQNESGLRPMRGANFINCSFLLLGSGKELGRERQELQFARRP